MELKLVRCDCNPEADPMNASTRGQTWTKFWLDPSTGRYGIEQAMNDNAQPMEEWLNLVLSINLQSRDGSIVERPDEDAARKYLESTEALALIRTIIDGFESRWDGNDMRGYLNDQAARAWEELLDELYSLPENGWSLWEMDEWFSHPEDLHVDAETTDDELRAKATEYEADARLEKVMLGGDVFEYLQGIRDEARAEAELDF